MLPCKFYRGFIPFTLSLTTSLVIYSLFPLLQAIWVFVRVPHAADITNVSHGDLPTGISLAKAVTGVQVSYWFCRLWP